MEWRIMNKIVLTSVSILSLIIFLTGCDNDNGSDEVNMCKELGYSGVVIENKSLPAVFYCSNGDKTPDGKCFVTLNGEEDIDTCTYREFETDLYVKQIK